MTEQLERPPGEADPVTAHILADLHDIRRALADALSVLSQVDQRSRDTAELLAELGPAARRAAAMFASPVGRWASPGAEPRQSRKERRKGRNDGSDAGRPATAGDRRPGPG
jgi:hypothetical protein